MYTSGSVKTRQTLKMCTFTRKTLETIYLFDLMTKENKNMISKMSIKPQEPISINYMKCCLFLNLMQKTEVIIVHLQA